MLSGSFDHTALVWPILDAIKVQHLTPGVLEGHSNSIWAVASVPTEPLSYLTGSADQLIKLFDYTNTAIKTFRGLLIILLFVSNMKLPFPNLQTKKH